MALEPPVVFVVADFPGVITADGQGDAAGCGAGKDVGNFGEGVGAADEDDAVGVRRGGDTEGDGALRASDGADQQGGHSVYITRRIGPETAPG